MSILISTVIYVILLFRLLIPRPEWILEFDFSNIKALKYVGLALVTTEFIMGIMALIAMRNSWRVGIKYVQKTELVISGIYRFSRNPYSLSYSLLILGYLFIFPSLVLMILLISLAAVFHALILEEEKYLLSVHADDYINYLRKVNRYFTL